MTTCANGSPTPSGSARCATSRARPGRRTSALPPRRSCAPRTAPAWCSTRCPACPKGFRVLLNMFAGARRNMTLGFPDHLTKWELSDAYREAYLTDPKIIPHEIVDDGPVFENVMTGDDIDVTKFPSPVWHEKDGGRYIGTGTYSVTRDPGGELAQRRRLSRAGARQDHGRPRDGAGPSRRDPLREVFQARTSRCRSRWCSAAIRSAFFYGGIEAPYGTFELDVVGGMRGRPMKMVQGQGHRPAVPGQRRDRARRLCRRRTSTQIEGPFGEWTGHYAGGAEHCPVLDIQAIYHRNDPILLGVPPMGGGPDEMARYRAVMRSAMIKQNMTQRRRAGRRPGLVPRDRRRAHAARHRDQAALSRPRGAGRASSRAQCGALGLCLEIHRGRGRRRRRDQSRPAAVGDADAHRSRRSRSSSSTAHGIRRPIRALSPEKRAKRATSRTRSPSSTPASRVTGATSSRRRTRRAPRWRARRRRNSAGCWIRRSKPVRCQEAYGFALNCSRTGFQRTISLLT